MIKLFKKFLACCFYLIVLSNSAYSQGPPADMIEDLKKVYSNLEYNTIAFNDLKEKMDYK